MHWPPKYKLAIVSFPSPAQLSVACSKRRKAGWGLKLPGILTNRPSSHCVCHTAIKEGSRQHRPWWITLSFPCVHLNHSTLWDQARGNPDSSVVAPSPVHTQSTPNSMGKSDKQGIVCARVHDDFYCSLRNINDIIMSSWFVSLSLQLKEGGGVSLIPGTSGKAWE